MTVDTRLAIASCTVRLTTRARELLGDDLPLIDDGVTVEHLLAQRSRIGDYLDENEAYQIDDSCWLFRCIPWPRPSTT